MDIVQDIIGTYPELALTVYLWILPIVLAVTMRDKHFTEIGKDTSLLALSLWGSAVLSCYKAGRFEGALAIVAFMIMGVLVSLYLVTLRWVPASVQTFVGQPASIQRRIFGTLVIGVASVGLAGTLGI